MIVICDFSALETFKVIINFVLTLKWRLERDVRERKAKELERYEECYAILAYKTKAFKKTIEHAVKTRYSLRKGWRLDIVSLIVTKRARSLCVCALIVCARLAQTGSSVCALWACTDGQTQASLERAEAFLGMATIIPLTLGVFRWILWIKQLKEKKKKEAYLNSVNKGDFRILWCHLF